MDIREVLIEHEREIVRNFPSLPRARSASHRIKFYQNLRHDGDLLAYVDVVSKDEQKDLNSEEKGVLTYESLLDVVKAFLSKVNATDFLDIQKIKVGDAFTHEEICALTGKYNFMQGMSIKYVDDEPAYAVVHSTLEQDPHIRNEDYNDHWIQYPDRMHYCMQTEPNYTADHPNFSIAANKIIFDSIITHSNFPVFLFVRDKAGDLFTFMGEYIGLKVDDDQKSFVLGKKTYDLAVDNVTTEEGFVERYCHENVVEMAKGKLLRKTAIPKADDPKSASLIKRARKVDYIRQAMINKRVGDLGEQVVLNYERARVAAFGEIAAPFILKIRKEEDDSKGFDIHSFDLENGKIVEIKIEVKTTTGEAKTTFFLSNNEYTTMNLPENKNHYWIYRVFNIHSLTPEFYEIRKDFEHKIRISPDTWRCDLIPELPAEKITLS
jgi:hypothetical protein